MLLLLLLLFSKDMKARCKNNVAVVAIAAAVAVIPAAVVAPSAVVAPVIALAFVAVAVTRYPNSS